MEAERPTPLKLLSEQTGDSVAIFEEEVPVGAATSPIIRRASPSHRSAKLQLEDSVITTVASRSNEQAAILMRSEVLANVALSLRCFNTACMRLDNDFVVYEVAV